MAKLTDVKTVDMVNGEITKITYDGEEYVRVASAKVGDIAVVVDAWGSALNGEYYFVNRASRGYVGIELKNHVGYDYAMRYFRNIFAQEKPTIEDVNAKVDGLSERVTALEKPVPLKVGDYAKVVGDSHSNQFGGKDGDIVKLIEEFTNRFRTETLDGEDFGGNPWAYKTSLTYATDEEVASAKAQAEADAVERKRNAIFTENGRKVNEYRVGDIVEFTDDYTAIGVVENLGGGTDDSDLIGVRCARLERSYQAPKLRDVKPIAFVESRLDRK